MKSVHSSLINLDQLKMLSDGNTSFMEMMFNAFRGEAAKFLHSFESQLISNDFDSMQKTAHRMKPSGAYIGADSLTILVTSLELAVKNSNRGETSSLFVQVQSMVKNILTELDHFRA